MSLWERIWVVIKTNLHTTVEEASDPEKLLDEAIQQMQEDLVGIRQSVAQAIALSKRTERQIKQYETQAYQWYQRAQLSLHHNYEDLARAALSKRQSYLELLQPLQQQHQQQVTIIQQLKQHTSLLEQKLTETKLKRDMYLTRVKSAHVVQKIHSLTFNLQPGNLVGIIDKLEQKVLELEAEVQLQRDPLESRFRSLEQQQKVETELTNLKTHSSLTDEELEIQKLKQELEQL